MRKEAERRVRELDAARLICNLSLTFFLEACPIYFFLEVHLSFSVLFSVSDLGGYRNTYSSFQPWLTVVVQGCILYLVAFCSRQAMVSRKCPLTTSHQKPKHRTKAWVKVIFKICYPYSTCSRSIVWASFSQFPDWACCFKEHLFANIKCLQEMCAWHSTPCRVVKPILITNCLTNIYLITSNFSQ